MQLKRTRLFNAEGDRDWGKRRIIGGNTTNMIELNNIKYEWAYKLYRAMMNNFLDSRGDPTRRRRSPIRSLKRRRTPELQQGPVVSHLHGQLLTHDLPNINEYITAPEVNLCLTVHAFKRPCTRSPMATCSIPS